MGSFCLISHIIVCRLVTALRNATVKSLIRYRFMGVCIVKLFFLAAFYPDSITKIVVTVNNDGDRTLVEWEGAAGTTELQEIAGLEGIIGDELTINGIVETGEYLGILEASGFVNSTFLYYSHVGLVETMQREQTYYDEK